MKKCVFAGSFDPFTNGHKDIVDRCLKMYDCVYIAVLNNQDKKTFFNDEERFSFIESLYANDERVKVCYFDGLLVDFMKANDITVNVRGLRNADDYKYENNMHFYNGDMYKELITVYIPCPLNLSHVSSSSVRSLIKAGADVSPYVPEVIAKQISKSLENKR